MSINEVVAEKPVEELLQEELQLEYKIGNVYLISFYEVRLVILSKITDKSYVFRFLDNDKLKTSSISKISLLRFYERDNYIELYNYEKNGWESKFTQLEKLFKYLDIHNTDLRDKMIYRLENFWK